MFENTHSVKQQRHRPSCTCAWLICALSFAIAYCHMLGVGVCTVFLPVGVENRLLFIRSVLGIFPGVSIGNDSCSFRLFRGVDSLAFSANFRLGVVNAPIPGWDILLPWGIFSGISISKFPDMLPLHSASNCRFTCMQ